MKCYRQNVGVVAEKSETQKLVSLPAQVVLPSSRGRHAFSRRVPQRSMVTLPHFEEVLPRSISDLKAFLRDSYSADLSEPFFQARFWEEITEDLMSLSKHGPDSTFLFKPRQFTVLHMFALLGLETETKTWLSISPLHRFPKDKQDNTPFHLALVAGHVALVSLFLSIPNPQTEVGEKQTKSQVDGGMSMKTPMPISREVLIDINGCYGPNSYTPLMTACKWSRISVARFLLSHSAKVNMRNKSGETALILAAANGSLEAVELLLSEKDININSVSVDDASALSAAAKHGHGKIVETLLNQPGLDQKHLGTALIAATDVSQTEIIRQILQTGRVPESSGSTALLDAARRGKSETVEALLNFDVNARVDVNARNPDGNTALHHAVNREYLRLVEVLLKHPNIKTDIRNNKGLTCKRPNTFSSKNLGRKIFGPREYREHSCRNAIFQHEKARESVGGEYKN
jgi:ankyrin repeat protein